MGMLSRENSSLNGSSLERMISESRPSIASRNESQDSLGMSTLDVEESEEENDGSKDLRGWIKIVNAFEQPRLVFNASRKHFEKSKTKPSLLSSPADRTTAFRNRYKVLHQRILRNESFQAPTTTATSAQAKQWRLTPIANLLGRSGSAHVLLGVLAITPTGTLALNDLTGSIQLDLDQATPIDSVETWLCPGMIVLVEGVYEEDLGDTGGSLAGQGGVGGTLGGRFVGFSIGAPKAETRSQSLGLSDGSSGDSAHPGGGFGWVDFLGVGSERAMGSRMRRLEQKLLNNPLSAHDTALSTSPGISSAAGKLVTLGCVTLDDPQTHTALRKLFTAYTASATHLLSHTSESITPASTLPTGFILFGPFTSQPALTPSASNEPNGVNSRKYKEAFDALAAILNDFPLLLRHCTFLFVPSTSDPWASAFSAGGAVPLPRSAVPDMFTTRVRREFAAANADTAARHRETQARHSDSVHGECILTSNPARVSVFGPNCEIVVARDDCTGRLRRNAVTFGKGRQAGGEDEQAGGEDSGVEMMSSPPRDVAPPEPQQESVGTENEGDGEQDVMDVDQPPRNRQTQPREEQVDPVTAHARRLTKTLLDQSHLAPYAATTQPLNWAYAQSLSLYPLPSALVLCDADAPAFAVVYQGCAVLNTGTLVGSLEGRGRPGVRWCEFDLRSRRGLVRRELL